MPSPTRYDSAMRLSVEVDREDDGRWIAEVPELPGVMVYGTTCDHAIGGAERLAVEVVADRVANGELPDSSFNLAFVVSDEQLAGI